MSRVNQCARDWISWMCVVCVHEVDVECYAECVDMYEVLARAVNVRAEQHDIKKEETKVTVKNHLYQHLIMIIKIIIGAMLTSVMVFDLCIVVMTGSKGRGK